MGNHLIYAKHPKALRRGDWYALWPVWALCAGLSLLLAFALAREYIADLPQKSDIPVVALGENRDLHLDTSKLNSRQFHLFEVSASGQKVRVVVQRTDDKAVRVALASCRTCYRSRDRHYAKRDR